MVSPTYWQVAIAVNAIATLAAAAQTMTDATATSWNFSGSSLMGVGEFMVCS
jgi:hypothetical protein